MTNGHKLFAVTVATILLAGCGSGESGDTAPSSGTVDPSAMTDAQAPPEQLVIDVTIKGGTATPNNEQLQAAVNEPIVIRVYSDAADELHVHSTPEHSFDIGIGPAQSFQFTVAVPGSVDIELHELHTTIATIQVR